MSKEELNTETQILNAAKKVFLNKGLDGTRMQEIADEAGINKSLLHYYFRTKEKLFDAVFTDAFQQFIPKVSEVMASDISLNKKIQKFVETYINMLIENPHIPMFILHEISRNPDKILKLMKSQGIKFEVFVNSIKSEIDKGKINPIDPRQLIVNMLGMCLFPIIAKPILKGFIFNNNDKAYKMFLEDRKKEVPKFIMNAIRKVPKAS